MVTHLRHLTQTSHPDLFVSGNGRLVHRRLGQLRRTAAHPVRLPGGDVLRILFGAPKEELTVNPLFALRNRDDPAATAEGVAIGGITKFMSDASGYLQVAEVAVELFDALGSFAPDTGQQIAGIAQQIETVMREVGAADYLNLLRAMDLMRANATVLMGFLANPAIRAQIGDPSSLIHLEYALADWNLTTDIVALLDPDEGFFKRAYFEGLIRGDGNWETIIPDRPVDANGATFEHRVAMPTVMYLTTARLASMKFLNPDFASTGLHSAEIDHWWRRIQQLSDEMSSYIRQSAPMPIAQQSARRQAAGQALGSYRDWQTHCLVSAPNSVAPLGAVDITTGFGAINWEYTQFDEWYLGQGDLHGGNAGYWPPSIGPQWYDPPANATGLPPMNDATVQRYYGMAMQDATKAARTVMDQIGVNDAGAFAWMMFDLAYPGAPTP